MFRNVLAFSGKTKKLSKKVSCSADRLEKEYLVSQNLLQPGIQGLQQEGEKRLNSLDFLVQVV